MVDSAYYLSAILVAAAVTFCLRALPFGMKAVLARSQLLEVLARWIPLGAMVILALYALAQLDFSSPSLAAPGLIAALVTVVVHLWRRNLMLTLLLGTLTCVVLSHWVFV